MVTISNRGVPADDYGSPFFLREYTRNVISSDLTKKSFLAHAFKVG